MTLSLHSVSARPTVAFAQRGVGLVALLTLATAFFGCAEGRSIGEPENICGDGRPRGDEECDDAEDNSDKIKDACRKDCTLPRCGDGVRDSGEDCDDGNEDPGDGCDKDCKESFTCGNETCEEDLSETCGKCADDCCPCGDGVCTFGEQCGMCPEDCCPACGDGVLDAGEGCDDGNNVDGDGCAKGCSDEDGQATCGNGFLELGEVCDDGNTVGSDGCGADCQLEYVCGDQVCENDVGENCATCLSDCCPNCGDAMVNDFEECDGSVPATADSCVDACYTGGSPVCGENCLLDYTTCDGELPTCGNGEIECGEQCDDAATDGATCADVGREGGALGCSASCTFDVSDCGGSLYIYEEHFDEGCPGGWSLIFPWQCGTPTTGPMAAYSEPNVIGVGFTGDYGNNNTYTNAVANSPPIDLSSAGAPVLAFKVWHSLQLDADAFQVQTSTDGITFTPASAASPSYGSDGGWTGITGGYTTYTVSIANLGGESEARIRFGLMSDSTSSFGGAFIDDVVIYDTCGNGELDLGEECDGDTGGATCDALEFDGGDLVCTSSCRFDISDCGESTAPLPLESFETCPPPGWTFAGVWECGDPTSGPNGAFTGENVIATNLDGDYTINLTYAANYAQTPAFDLEGDSPILTFAAWIQSESTLDGMHVEASTNGTTWTTVPSVTPAYTGTIGGQPGWGGSALNSWRGYTVDLSAYSGENVSLRFAFRSDGSVNYPGAYIDDVKVSNNANSIPIVLGTVAPLDVYTGQDLLVQIPMTSIGAASWSITDSDNADWIEVDADTGELTGTPSASDAGDFSITVRAERASLASNFDEITISGTVLEATYFEGFTTCPGGFTFTGDWECGAVTSTTPADAFSLPNCIGTNTYSNSRAWGSTLATSPTISLDGLSAPQLRFMFWSDIESTFDGCHLEVSVNGGSFTTVTNVMPGYTQTLDGQQAWADYLTWTLVTADLSAYAGDDIQLRWSFRSDISGTYPGPFIDDIAIVDP